MRRSRGLILRRAALGAVAILASSSSGTLAATIEAERFGTAVGHLMTDGVRYAAVATSSTTVRIVDTKNGGRRDVTLGAGCELVDVGGARLLVSCSTLPAPNPKPMVYSAATGKQLPITGFDAVVMQSQQRGLVFDWSAIGRHWLRVRASNPHLEESWYLNWHTGELAGEPQSADRIADLSAPSLERRMCSPLRRTPRDPLSTPLSSDPFLEYHYDRPYGVGATASGTLLQRCHRTKRQRLRGCSRPCLGLQIGSGALTWWVGDSFYLRELAATRTYRLTAGNATSAWVSHTRCRIFVSEPTRAAAQGPVRLTLYRAKRPSCSPPGRR